LGCARAFYQGSRANQGGTDDPVTHQKGISESSAIAGLGFGFCSSASRKASEKNFCPLFSDVFDQAANQKRFPLIVHSPLR
jgi:hypothetical protein